MIISSTWLGLGKLGVISGQINTNIRGASLVHTLDVVKAKAIIFTNETEQGISQWPKKHPSFFKA